MSSSLKDLLEQKAALDAKIVETQRSERSQAIAQIKSLMTEYGLTASDLSLRNQSAAAPAAKKKVPAKYRDSSTGDSWSGRGLQPNWLRKALATGRKLSDFAL